MRQTAFATPPAAVVGAACPICDLAGSTPFVTLTGVPVNISDRPSSRDAALAVPRADLVLSFCPGCGMVYNPAFRSELVEYGDTFENSLDSSPTFARYADDLAASLVSSYRLDDKLVVDVGSGKGTFLRRLLDAGAGSAIGFDPTYEGPTSSEDGRLRFVREFYTDAHAGLPVDFVSCRHVLEHIAKPAPFLRDLRRIVGDRKPPMYFEVPNGTAMLDGSTAFDAVYPHCSYFTPNALRRLFAASGYVIRRLSTAYNDQFLAVEVAPLGNGPDLTEPADDATDGLAALVAGFANRFTTVVETWGDLLAAAHSAGRPVALWGAGAKGTTFLNVVPGGGDVEVAVDLNPAKHGFFVPGTGQRIVGPADLPAVDPALVVVANPLYREEIQRSVSDLGLTAYVMSI